LKKEKKEKYDKFFLETAKLSANMSFCKRRKVGAILTKNTRIISNGWNGTVSGEDNCCEELYESESDIETAILEKDKNYEKKAKEFCNENGLIFENSYLDNNEIIVKYRRPQYRTKNSVVHAEANAISYAAKEGISTNNCTLYVTLSPCMNCANLIIQAGIKEVVYLEEYRDKSGVNYLKKHNIITRNIKI